MVNLIPSDIAKEYQARFKEVLVDEYQDTNLLQETILQFVKSGDEQTGNMFMVGDVKQSIYRFRLAEPMLFLGKYLKFDHEPIDAGSENRFKCKLPKPKRSVTCDELYFPANHG